MVDLSQFYFAFENRFRGSSDDVRAKLAFYVPHLDALKAATPAREALDLGCGRGEWLDLLREQGFSPRGVDTNGPMVEACRARGHAVEHTDVGPYLAAVEPASLAIVSAFHVVEHIPFEAVYETIRHAFRALAPGGLLLLETPNPGNLFVGHTFYVDPTHLKPVPSALLSFALEYHGFNPVRTIELHSSLDGVAPLRWLANVRGVKRFIGGRDYVVLGTKP